MNRVVASLFFALSFACGSTPKQTPAASAGAATSASASAAALAKAPTRITFVENDFAKAKAKALAENKLLFVDAWAPWCHSCLSMRANVMGDPSLVPLEKKYVFASLDTERDDSTDFVTQFPLSVWPTLFVIDPKTNATSLRWGGTATADELVSLLSSSERAHADPVSSALLGTFVKVTEAFAQDHVAEGVRLASDALARSTESSLVRDQLVEALVSALSLAKDHACAPTALRELPKMTDGTSKWTVIATGLGCVENSVTDRQKLTAEAEHVLENPSTRVAADDVSGVFEALVDSYQDEKKVHALADKWAKYLETQAAAATDPVVKSVYDAHRLLAYLALGDPKRAIPMLQESEKNFPDDYNPPIRLARVYKELGNLNLAAREAERATHLVYGPRLLRVYALAAEIAENKKDTRTAIADLELALNKTDAMPLHGSYKKLREQLTDKLGKLKAR